MSTTITQTLNEQQFMSAETEISFKPQWVWRNVALFLALHVGALIGAYQLFFVASWLTVAWTVFLWCASSMGVTAGAHRLWAHRSFKARFPARVILMLMQTVAFQNDVIEWARDHRSHHKWTDTDADPHTTTRGFFFAHMGWLLMKKHPQVKTMGGKLDLSDLFADPVLRFQRRYYLLMVVLFCFLLPTVIPTLLWGESAFVAFYTAALLRYCFTLHMTWCINSVAHTFGFRPYDAYIRPTDAMFTTVMAVGEGGHNYHHTFPQDYRTSEFSARFNWTKILIDAFAALGWVYDRKVVPKEIIERQKAKHGDGSNYTLQ